MLEIANEVSISSDDHVFLPLIKQQEDTNSDRAKSISENWRKHSDSWGDNPHNSLTRAGFKGEVNERLHCIAENGGKACAMTLIGIGEGLANAQDVRKLAYSIRKECMEAGVGRAVVDLRGLELTKLDSSLSFIKLFQEGLELAAYRFNHYLEKDSERKKGTESTVLLGLQSSGEAASEVQTGKTIASAIGRARDLANGPAGLVTPTFLAEHAQAIVQRTSQTGADVSCTILERKDCEDRGMGMFLGVAQGSDEPPKFIHLSYKPKGASQGRICLVGKAVTFDSGGYSIKSSENMMGMKLDMSGSAAVLGAFEGIVELGLPYEVHAIAAAAENMVSGHAYRLGDVLRASNGTTVEINNTDAEGRLTLGDALLYAGQLKPDLIIDFATLTGACVVALGPQIAGVMTPHDDLAQSWIEAGAAAGEEMWRLPLPEHLMYMLESKIADLRNTGERAGGTLTAGLFLKQFVKGQRWMHVDIAGPAMCDRAWGVNEEGGTGSPVATILEFLQRGKGIKPSTN